MNHLYRFFVSIYHIIMSGASVFLLGIEALPALAEDPHGILMQKQNRNPLIYKGLRYVRPAGFEPVTFRVGV